MRALCRAYGQMEEGGKRALLCVVAQCLGVDDGEVRRRCCTVSKRVRQ